eukprot:gene1519-12645_t
MKQNQEYNGKDADSMTIISSFPLKIEPSNNILMKKSITPTSSFFVNNHGNIPKIKEENYQLEIKIDLGSSKKQNSYNLKELKNKFQKYSSETCLVGSGFRRNNKSSNIENSNPENQIENFIGNTIFTGCRLNEVLNDSGMIEMIKLIKNESDIVICFEGFDEIMKDNFEKFHFENFIPFSKGISNEVLLVYEMNNQQLLPCHGYPIRVIVPGYAACNSVKWLSRITIMTIADESIPSLSLLFNDEKLKDLNVNSKILIPHDSVVLKEDDKLNIQGIAFTGNCQKIAKVLVSFDEGENYEEVDEIRNNEKFRLVSWKKEFKVPKNIQELSISCLAIDTSFNSQPHKFLGSKLFMNNSVHQVKYKVES